jgi:formylglycine-generating enzyme required for sulfatase activity
MLRLNLDTELRRRPKGHRSLAGRPRGGAVLWLPILLTLLMGFGACTSAWSAASNNGAVKAGRLALVIANGQYHGLPVLDDTYSDGDRIAAALTATNFVDASGLGPVKVRRDLTEAQLNSELTAFRDQLKASGPNSFGIVYYSGHGAALGAYGDTALLAIDQSVDAPGDLVTRAKIADLLLASNARTVVVVLDMCRSISVQLARIAAVASPSGSSATSAPEVATKQAGGYRPTMRRPDQGYLVAYSTSADQAAFDDGVFSTVLAEEIQRPHQNLAEVFKRVSDRVAVLHSSPRYWQKPTFDYGLSGGGPCLVTCDPAADPARFYDCANCPWMRVIPAGVATIGSPPGEVGRSGDEPGPHQVRFDTPFAAAVFTVTISEWRACELDGVCRQRPNWSKDSPNPLIPQTHLSFEDAQNYVHWLSRKSGRNYRLPTGDEWEYAARAGVTSAFSFGDDISPSLANYDQTERYRNSPTAPYRGYPEAVSAYPANDFGLVQVEGNVWQWTSDCRAGLEEPCSEHTLRGGSFESTPRELRLAHRFVIGSDKARDDVGLRVVRDIDPDEGFQ